MKKREAVWIVCVILSFLSMLALVLKFLPYELNSDSAFFPLLARWEYATGNIFPEGMCYSTQVMGFSPNLFMIPYLAIFGEHYLLVRTLGIFTIWIIIICAVFVLFRGRSLVPASVVIILLMIPYLGSSATAEYFFEAGYVNQIKWLAVGLILSTYLWEQLGDNRIKNANASPGDDRKRTRKVAAAAFVLIAVIVYSNSCGIRNLLISFIPMTGALILYVILEHLDELSTEKADLTQWVVERGKTVLPFAVIFLTGGILALLVYRGISARVWTYEEQTSVSLAPANIFAERVLKLINSLVDICGNRISAPMFSARGISKLVNYFYAAFLYVGVPRYSVRNFGKLREDRTKLIILTAHISSFLLAFICITANLEIISNDETRYCLPIFVNNIFVLGALIMDRMQADENGTEHAKPAKDKEPAEHANVPLKLFIRYIPVIVICYAVFSHLIFWKANVSKVKNRPDPYGLTAYLEELGYTHGYASYWNGHKNTILSDCRVEVAGVKVNEFSIEPYYWLTNREYYSTDYYDGPTFLVLTEKEVALFDAHGGAAETYGIPKEQLQYENLTIYLYDYNIISVKS